MRYWLVATFLVLLVSPVQAQVNHVGFWNFDEGSGAVASDSSGEANHGTISGATWIGGAQGPHALRFGGNDGVSMGNPMSLEPATLTVGMCVRSSAPQPYKLLLSEGLQGCDCASYALVRGHDSEVYFYTCNGTSAPFSAVIPGAEIWDGQWHRVVATYDGADVRIYLDGVPVGLPVAGTDPSYSLSTHSNFQIGNIGACGVGGFQGDIDEVGVLDGALSDLEIEALGDCNDLFDDGFESGNADTWSSTEP